MRSSTRSSNSWPPGWRPAAPRLLTIPLVVAGTDEQRARWLPRFTAAQFTVATAAFTEPRWDFDSTALATRAVRQGGDWVIAGEKCLGPLLFLDVDLQAIPEGDASLRIAQGKGA